MVIPNYGMTVIQIPGKWSGWQSTWQAMHREQLTVDRRATAAMEPRKLQFLKLPSWFWWVGKSETTKPPDWINLKLSLPALSNQWFCNFILDDNFQVFCKRPAFIFKHTSTWYESVPLLEKVIYKTARLRVQMKPEMSVFNRLLSSILF